jgi:hypothetical protein
MRRWGPLLFLVCGGCWWDSCAEAPTPELALPLPETPCQERRTRVGLDAETEFGRASDLLPQIEGDHSGTLLWSRGGRTRIDIDAWDARAFVVQSQAPSGYVAANIDRSCIDRMEIELEVAINTTDGRLVEEMTTLVLRVFSDVEAFGSFYIPYDGFGGSYAPTRNQHCFEGSQIKVLLGATGFNGSINDEFSAGNCDVSVGEPRSFSVAGHWGDRWQSY